MNKSKTGQNWKKEETDLTSNREQRMTKEKLADKCDHL